LLRQRLALRAAELSMAHQSRPKNGRGAARHGGVCPARGQRRSGGIDILFLNMGGPKAGPTAGQDAASWSAAFEAIALPFFAMSEMFLPGPRGDGPGGGVIHAI